jgi:hypothetical protein
VTGRGGRRAEFVFGYGSLASAGSHQATREFHRRGFVAELAGVARGWGVAMDNSVDLPGYKYYEDAAGARPEVFVAFLDLADDPAPGASVNGLCRPVDGDALAQLDLRERNYVRLDVSERVDSSGGRVWAYVGSRCGRARLREGRRRGSAVIQAGYLRSVRLGFRELGPQEYDACAASLEPGGLAVVELVRRELPADV